MTWLVQASGSATGTLVHWAESTPEPSLRPGLEATDVSPGFLGFLVTFLVVVATILLLLSMTRRVRRLGHRDGEDHTVEAEIRTKPEPMGAVPPTAKEVRQARKRARAQGVPPVDSTGAGEDSARSRTDSGAAGTETGDDAASDGRAG